MSKDQIVPRTRPRAALFTGLLATSLAAGVLTAAPAQALSGNAVAMRHPYLHREAGDR